MKRILLLILSSILLMLLWAGITLLGTINGWFHKPITKSNMSASFPEAFDVEVNKQFVGNFAMAVMKDGIVEYEKFYSAGKAVDRNTIFQVSSLSKWISAIGIMKLVEDVKLDFRCS